MGVENNECIVATTWSDDIISQVSSWIKDLPPEHQQLFVNIPSLVNGKTTIVLGTSGSKKGWELDQTWQKLKDAFVEKLQCFDHGDGSNPFDWVEVSYGEFGQKILQGNCTNKYSL